MPRVNGGSPGRPMSRSGSKSSQRPARSGSPRWSTAVGPPGPARLVAIGSPDQSHGPYSRSTSTSLIVLKPVRRSGARSRAARSRSCSHARRRADQVMGGDSSTGPGASSAGRASAGTRRGLPGGRPGRMFEAIRTRNRPGVPVGQIDDLLLEVVILDVELLAGDPVDRDILGGQERGPWARWRRRCHTTRARWPRSDRWPP